MRRAGPDAVMAKRPSRRISKPSCFSRSTASFIASGSGRNWSMSWSASLPRWSCTRSFERVLGATVTVTFSLSSSVAFVKAGDDDRKFCRPGAMVIRRLPPAITESPEKLIRGARGGAELADGARLAIFFAVVLTAFLAAFLAGFLAAFLNVFFAALLAPFFAVFAFATRLAIGKPLEEFRTTTLPIISATLRYAQRRSLAPASSSPQARLHVCG